MQATKYLAVTWDEALILVDKVSSRGITSALFLRLASIIAEFASDDAVSVCEGITAPVGAAVGEKGRAEPWGSVCSDAGGVCVVYARYV